MPDGTNCTTAGNATGHCWEGVCEGELAHIAGSWACVRASKPPSPAGAVNVFASGSAACAPGSSPGMRRVLGGRAHSLRVSLRLPASITAVCCFMECALLLALRLT